MQLQGFLQEHHTDIVKISQLAAGGTESILHATWKSVVKKLQIILDCGIIKL